MVSFLPFDDFQESKNFTSKLSNPEKEYKRKEFREDFFRALDTLPLKQRSVFTMKQIDGLKHQEIARIMGITEGGVKASYFQAVKKLRSLLKTYGDGYEM